MLAAGSVLTLSACLPGADDEPARPTRTWCSAAGPPARWAELVASYAAVVAAFPQADAQQLDTLRSLAAEHEAHVRGAGRAGAAGLADGIGHRRRAGRPCRARRRFPLPLRWLAGLERAAARRRTRPVAAGRAGPGPAARRGRCERGDPRRRAGPRGPRMSRRSDVAVLQEVLAAEHAVVYGYGVAGAHLRGAARARAERGWTAHRAGRDALEQQLSDLVGHPGRAGRGVRAAVAGDQRRRGRSR